MDMQYKISQNLKNGNLQTFIKKVPFIFQYFHDQNMTFSCTKSANNVPRQKVTYLVFFFFFLQMG